MEAAVNRPKMRDAMIMIACGRKASAAPLVGREKRACRTVEFSCLPTSSRWSRVGRPDAHGNDVRRSCTRRGTLAARVLSVNVDVCHSLKSAWSANGSGLATPRWTMHAGEVRQPRTQGPRSARSARTKGEFSGASWTANPSMPTNSTRRIQRLARPGSRTRCGTGAGDRYGDIRTMKAHHAPRSATAHTTASRSSCEENVHEDARKVGQVAAPRSPSWRSLRRDDACSCTRSSRREGRSTVDASPSAKRRMGGLAPRRLVGNDVGDASCQAGTWRTTPCHQGRGPFLGPRDG